MKKLLFSAPPWLLFAPLCFFSSLTLASVEAKEPATAMVAPAKTALKPALWVLKDDDTTIYLFGTIHALRDGEDWMSPPVKAAFEASDKLVLEIIAPESPQDMQAKVLKYAVNRDGPALSSRLSPEKRAAYHAALAAYAMPPAALDTFHPWYVATMLTMLPLMKAGYDPQQGVEARLTSLAKPAKKALEALETVDQQFAIFRNISDAEQIHFLNESVKMHGEATALVDKMVGYWRSGQADELGQVMNESLESSPDLAEAMLYQRNEIWASQLQDRLNEPGTQFIAVGAGHLAGERSVQHYLKARGLTALRLDY